VRSHASLAGALLCAISASALAQPNNSATNDATAKAGWKMDGGAALHDASMTACPATLPGLEALTFIGRAEPNIIGTCTYKDGAGGGDAGMQVRRYMRDVGESQDAIQNDRALMEPGPDAPFMMVRFTPIMTRDGKRGGRVVITKTRGGLLIDCFGEAESLEKASEKIGLFCKN
jgi:hypothetical protein